MSIGPQSEEAGLQLLGAYSVEYTEKDILVNGPELTICQEIAQDIRDGKKVVVIINNEQFLIDSKSTKNTSTHLLLLEPTTAPNTSFVSPDSDLCIASSSKGKKSRAPKQKKTANYGGKINIAL